MTNGRQAAALALVLLAAAVSRPVAVSAQLPRLDPIPWFTPADSTSRLALVVAIDRFVDRETEWSTTRVVLTAMLPAGSQAAWFLRMPYVAFDTDGYGVAERWPLTVVPEQPADWPGGERLNGFGQLEVGATGPFGLPFLGPWHYGLGIGLPTGTNRAYPWSSTSLPLRLQVRRDVPLGGAWHLWCGGGYLLHMNAAGDQLDASAFPNGWQLQAELATYRGRGSAWHLVWAWEDRNTRLSQILGLRLSWPWTDDGSFGVEVARELRDIAHRPAQWFLTLSWRFDSPRARPAPASPTP